MSYIETNLVPGESIVFKTKLHWWVIFVGLIRALWAGLLLVLAAYVFLELGSPRSSRVLTNTSTISLTSLCLICGLPLALFACIVGILNYLSSEFGLTTRRVMIKTGIIRRHTLELNLGKIESFQIRETILGRILGYKTIILTGSGGTKQTFKYVDQAREFQRKVTELSTDRHAEYDELPVASRRGRQNSVFDESPLPDNTEQLLRNAAQQIQLGNRQAAQEIVRGLMQTAPDNADVWYLVGYLSSSVEKKKQAFERALRIDPRHKRAQDALDSLQ